jgi:Aldehyde oxidase and xanthine dehydrogenase, a/b hammerhead domain
MWWANPTAMSQQTCRCVPPSATCAVVAAIVAHVLESPTTNCILSPTASCCVSSKKFTAFCVLSHQVTGEAVYVDDMPLPANALHAVFVLSTRPHAKLLNVDASAALEVSMW